MKLTKCIGTVLGFFAFAAATAGCVSSSDPHPASVHATAAANHVASTPGESADAGHLTGGPVLTGWSVAPPSPELLPTLFGYAAPFARVEIYSSAACNDLPIGTAFGDADGVFSAQVAVNTNGTTVVSAAALDDYGQWTCSSDLSYTHEDSPPLIVPESPSPHCGVVAGYSVPGNSVALYDDAMCSDMPLAPVAVTTADADGHFEVSVCAPTPVVYARSFDPYGQGSTCSEPLLIQF